MQACFQEKSEPEEPVKEQKAPAETPKPDPIRVSSDTPAEVAHPAQPETSQRTGRKRKLSITEKPQVVLADVETSTPVLKKRTSRLVSCGCCWGFTEIKRSLNDAK